MISSYIKTAGRNLVRNKLFSGINIAGLAIGMAVGLLVITLIHDLFSYDRFHQKRDRIYRLITTRQQDQKDPQEFASTSVKLGQICQRQVAGIDEVAILRRGFSGDATVKGTTIPLNGLWATPSFFTVFTFPFLKGDPATALKEPHSIVLTPKTAQKLFGKLEPLNQVIRLDSADYKVTGIVQELPLFSHIQFEALVSFATLEQANREEPSFLSWGNIADTYVYILLPKNGDAGSVQRSLAKVDQRENISLTHAKLSTHLQPLTDIFLGKDLQDEIGHSLPLSTLWIIIALALVAILTACFNYTNLSVARSLRRSREVGVRKVLGAVNRQVFVQFITESISISLIALLVAGALFVSLRSAFLALGPSFATLQVSPLVLLSFIALAILVGIIAGFLPALSLAKINPLQVLKTTQSLKLFGHLNLRKALIFSQYSFSLFFVAITVVIYKQYDFFVTQDLGFRTENILNISLQGNPGDRLKQELTRLSDVSQISQAKMVTSLGATYGTFLKYKNPQDSVATNFNGVDEQYVPLHQYKLLAGRNIKPQSAGAPINEILINQQLMKHFNLGSGNPEKAVGSMLTEGANVYLVVGVLKDFHYHSLYQKIEPVFFRYAPSEANYLNVKIRSGNWPATLAAITQIWKRIDSVHPLAATLYQDDIQAFYRPLSVMSKIIGGLAFLTILIASMGLFGMVVFTAETRLKEVSIRKVLGASEVGMLYMLSKGFLVLLFWAALLGLVSAYFLVDQFMLSLIAYPAPIPIVELIGCMLVFIVIALAIISSQTIGVTRRNPAQVLKAE